MSKVDENTHCPVCGYYCLGLGGKDCIGKPSAVEAIAKHGPCSLGCKTACKAKEHGCASECPALPWPPVGSQVSYHAEEANEKLRKMVDAPAQHGHGDAVVAGSWDHFKLLMEESEQQGKCEPVAYQFQSEDGTWHCFMDERHYENTKADGRWPIRALYTAHQPIPPKAHNDPAIQEAVKAGRITFAPGWNDPQPLQDREPLTDEQIRSMCKETWVFDTVKQWARLIEAAHGIK